MTHRSTAEVTAALGSAGYQGDPAEAGLSFPQVFALAARAYAERQLHVFPGGFVQQHAGSTAQGAVGKTGFLGDDILQGGDGASSDPAARTDPGYLYNRSRELRYFSASSAWPDRR